MKEDYLYSYYLRHLDDKLIEGKLTNGSFYLLKISESAFIDFKFKFENNEKISTKFKRDKKIDDLFNDI